MHVPTVIVLYFSIFALPGSEVSGIIIKLWLVAKNLLVYAIW